MTRLAALLLLILHLSIPVEAVEYTAPEVPDSGRDIMPSQTQSFGDGLAELLKKVCTRLRPDLAEAVSLSTGIIATALLVGILRTFPGISRDMVDLAGTVIISVQLLSSASSMIRLGCETIIELSNYGKLLIPVMAAALAAQGGVTSATTLYIGTTVFDTVLSGLISSFFTPLVFILMVLGIAGCALGDDTLKKIQEMGKSAVIWSLKTIMIVYTAYIGITGVVSGTTDAAALKAAKLTISTVVPVVGGILSDASEAVLVSVGTMKNAAGIYGILAAASIFLGPFLKIGAHYLVLKGTGAICSVIDSKGAGSLVDVFSEAMGVILAMTGTCCMLLLVSTVCFLRGMNL